MSGTPPYSALEGRIGRVCLTYAQTEQEAGLVVQAAHGNWDVNGSEDYLCYSAQSGRLIDWLKSVARAYPEHRASITTIIDNLRALKATRDTWAHSSDTVDLFLHLLQTRTTTIDHPRDSPTHSLLNSRKRSHTRQPDDIDVENYARGAAELIADARRTSVALARHIEDHGLRTISEP